MNKKKNNKDWEIRLYLWLCVVIAHRFKVTIHKNHVILHSLTFQSTYMTMITKHLFFILYYYNIYIYTQHTKFNHLNLCTHI